MPTKQIFQTNWKKTQSEAFSFADDKDYDLVIARKYTDAKGYEFDAIPSNKYNKFMLYADENKEAQLISTIIREGQNDKMRLDIEIYLTNKSYIKKAKNFLDELIDDIAEYADIDNTYFESDNSRNSDQKEGYIYKFSKHIFFNYYFETGKHQKEFWRKFLLKFPDYKSITTNKMLFEFDTSVYEKNSQWNESKRTSERSLVDRCPTIIDYDKYQKIDVDIDAPVAEVKKEVKKKLEEVEEVDKDENNKSNSINDSKPPKETLEEIKKLCDMLSDERISNYNSWMKLIFCLASISTHKEVKKIALNISGRSEKSNNKDFEKLFESLWKLPEGNKFTIGTLYYWAKNDSPKKYEEFIKTKFTALKKECLLADEESDEISIIKKLSSDTTDRGIAMSLYKLLKDKIKVTSKGQVYVTNKNNVWISEDISYLDKILLFDVYYLFTKIYYQNIAINSEKATEEEYEFNKKCGIAMSINIALSNAKSYKAIRGDYLVKLLSDSNFEEKLDSNLDLFAFSDKVIDLRTKEIRDIKPNDYISINTGYTYPTSKLKYVDEINDFFNKIHPNPQIKKYMFDVLSMALCGTQSEESVFTHSGKDGIGGSGKSKTFSLIKKVFGNYAYCMPNDLLYSKSNVNAQAPRPDILYLKGKRFVWCSEPDAGQKLNIAFLKKATGSDVLTGRKCQLNNMIEFIPQLQMHILCNKMLSFDDNSNGDDGFKRRNKVIQYSSKFIQDVTEIDEENHIFLADPFIENRFKLWRDDFIRMLIDNYKHESTLIVPDIIKEFSQFYLDSNNQLIDFIDKYLIKTDNKKDIIKIQEIKNMWENDKDFEKIKLKDLILNCKITLKKNYFERVKIDSKDYRNIITGYKLKGNDDDDDDDNDNCLIED